MKRLGMLSLGQLTALCTVAGVVAVMAVRGHQLFSPGALNADGRYHVALQGVTSHAELANNCAACHAPPWGGETMSSRCLDCHADVRAQLERKKPMHGLLAQGRTCQSCHTEHKGPHAALTNMDTFDHTCTAFPLTGKHQAVDCKACHTSNFYKGTSHTCAACHAEPKEHKGRFGNACAECHSTNNWQASTVTLVKFDHNLTRYPLTGKHRAVDCKACHAREVSTEVSREVFKGTPQSCASCHAEPVKHKGRYGASCATCHATTGWQDVTFRHSFPLNHGGNRKAASCATCHPSTEHFKTYTCYGCHHTPAREEQRHARRKIADLNKCVVCHPTGRGAVRRTALPEECPEMHVARGCPEVGRGVPQLWAMLTPAFRQNGPRANGVRDFLRVESSLPVSGDKDQEPMHPVAQAHGHLAMNQHPSGGDLFRNLFDDPLKLRSFGRGNRTPLEFLGVGQELPPLRSSPARKTRERDQLLMTQEESKTHPPASAGVCPFGNSSTKRGDSRVRLADSGRFANMAMIAANP